MLTLNEAQCMIVKDAIKDALKDTFTILHHDKFKIRKDCVASSEEDVIKNIVLSLLNPKNLALMLTFETYVIQKEKESLASKLGQEVLQTILDELVITPAHINPMPLLRSLVIEVFTESQLTEVELKAFSIPKEERKRSVQLKKEGIAERFTSILKKHVGKSNSTTSEKKFLGKTVLESVQEHIVKYAREPIDVLKFKHAMRTLGRSHAEKFPERVSNNEVKIAISKKELIEHIAEKKYSNLQTKTKDRIMKRLGELQDDKYFLLNSIGNDLSVYSAKLYRIEGAVLLSDGSDIYILYVNIFDQDFNHNNYIAIETSDFTKASAYWQKFWKNGETDMIIDKKRLRKRNSRTAVPIDEWRWQLIQSNKILQAAILKMKSLLQAKFHPSSEFGILEINEVDDICGITAAAKSIAGEGNPNLEFNIREVSRGIVLSIAKNYWKLISGVSLKNNKLNLRFHKPHPVKKRPITLQLEH
jgi:hypothetical protein